MTRMTPGSSAVRRFLVLASSSSIRIRVFQRVEFSSNPDSKATNATNATKATKATKATNATKATKATKATNATNATNATTKAT